MTQRLIGRAVYSGAQLAQLLPEAVCQRLEPAMFADACTAAALRVLATIDEAGWHPFVRPAFVQWAPMLAWARSSRASNSVRARVEAAASLAGYAHARPDLSAIAWKLDGDNLAAVLDALRIARRGVVL